MTPPDDRIASDGAEPDDTAVPTATDAPFETETMAELHARQGRLADAAALYRKLLASPDASPDVRARREARLRELEMPRRSGAFAAVGQNPSAARASALPTPGLRLARHADHVEVAWSLPADTAAPALVVVTVARTDDASQGPTVARRIVALEATAGSMRLDGPPPLAIAIAAGPRRGDDVVPMVHTRDSV